MSSTPLSGTRTRRTLEIQDEAGPSLGGTQDEQIKSTPVLSRGEKLKQLHSAVPEIEKEEGVIRRRCTYKKGGLCHLHGCGTVRKWKPLIKTEMGEGGNCSKEKIKRMFLGV